MPWDTFISLQGPRACGVHIMFGSARLAARSFCLAASRVMFTSTIRSKHPRTMLDVLSQHPCRGFGDARRCEDSGRFGRVAHPLAQQRMGARFVTPGSPEGTESRQNLPFSASARTHHSSRPAHRLESPGNSAPPAVTTASSIGSAPVTGSGSALVSVTSVCRAALGSSQAGKRGSIPARFATAKASDSGNSPRRMARI